MDPKISGAEDLGDELKASELQTNTVVVLSRDGIRCVTAWVTHLTKEFAAFSLGEIKTTLLLLIRADGTLVDDTGKQVRVFKFKGEV